MSTATTEATAPPPTPTQPNFGLPFQLHAEIEQAIGREVDQLAGAIHAYVNWRLTQALKRKFFTDDTEATPAFAFSVASHAPARQVKLCASPNCGKPARAKGLCSTCYQRDRRAGLREAEKKTKRAKHAA